MEEITGKGNRTMSSSRRVAALTAAGVLGALAAGVGIGAGVYASVAPKTTTTVVQDVNATGRTENASATAPAGGLSVNGVYDRTHEGVVDITVNATSQSNNPFGFGGTRQTQAEGSGWVYDAKGDIVTNQHVVSGASSITVTLANGKSYKAHLVGSDSSTDLAVVRISAPGLTALQLGNSDAVEVGDPVVAIGSPFGLPQTVTSGIVSALHRTIDSPNNFSISNSIQTDAPINHGNSGGPLLNSSAQVIGVNSQIQSDSGGNDGVGFAIPSNTVRSVVAQIVSGKTVAHAYLGVQVRDSSSPLGAELAAILPGTPAAKAGLKAGDVVTAIDGKAVTGQADVSTALGSKKPGDTISVTYERGSQIATVKVTLTSRPS
jgi:putative serine protease PepD